MAGRSGIIYLADAIADGGYEISYDMLGLNGFCTVGDEFPIGTYGSAALAVAAAATKYTWFIPWAQATIDPGGSTRTPTAGAPAWSDADVLACYSIVAAAHDAVWVTGGGVDQVWQTSAPPLSRATIYFPQGSFAVNFPILTCYGSYIGFGNSQYANEANDANQTVYGTRLFVDHANWLNSATVVAPERYIFRSVNFIEEVGGTLYGGINGDTTYQNQLATYLEGCIISNFRLDGMKSSAPETTDDGYSYSSAYHSSGIAMLRLGSASSVSLNRCDNFNNAGIELCGGTPATLDTNRCFFNNYAGLWLRGAGQVFYTSLEGDDNPTLIKFTDYSTTSNSGIIAANGANIVGIGTKMESGTQTSDGVNIYGAGSTAVNAVFYYRDGDANGYPRYTLVGGVTDDDSVYRDPAGPSGDRWYINSGGAVMYNGVPDGMSPDNPWASTPWAVETGSLPVPTVRQGRPTKGQMMLDAEGWIIATFTGVDYVGVNGFSECLVRVKNGVSYATNSSYVSVDGLRTFGFFRTLVHHADGANSKKFLLDKGQYTKKWTSSVHCFKYNSASGGYIDAATGDSVRTILIPYEDRQMWLQETDLGGTIGSWDDTVNPGTPVYSY